MSELATDLTPCRRFVDVDFSFPLLFSSPFWMFLPLTLLLLLLLLLFLSELPMGSFPFPLLLRLMLLVVVAVVVVVVVVAVVVTFTITFLSFTLAFFALALFTFEVVDVLVDVGDGLTREVHVAAGKVVHHLTCFWPSVMWPNLK